MVNQINISLFWYGGGRFSHERKTYDIYTHLVDSGVPLNYISSKWEVEMLKKVTKEQQQLDTSGVVHAEWIKAFNSMSHKWSWVREIKTINNNTAAAHTSFRLFDRDIPENGLIAWHLIVTLVPGWKFSFFVFVRRSAPERMAEWVVQTHRRKITRVKKEHSKETRTVNWIGRRVLERMENFSFEIKIRPRRKVGAHSCFNIGELCVAFVEYIQLFFVYLLSRANITLSWAVMI